MPQFPQMFDATQHEPAGNASPQLPVSGPDGLPVIIHGSEFVKAKSNDNNGYLRLDLTVIDGQYKGEQGVYRINLWNDNAKTVEIANGQLSAVCHCVNQYKVVATEQLYNIPFRVITRYQKKLSPEQQAAKDRGEEVTPFTEVCGVLRIDGTPAKNASGQALTAAPNAPPAPPQPAQPAQPVAPAQPAAGAWNPTEQPVQPVQPEQPAAPTGAQPWATSAPGAAAPWGPK